MQRSALCRSRRELSNAYLLAKIGVDTAENEPCKVCPVSAYRSPGPGLGARLDEQIARVSGSLLVGSELRFRGVNGNPLPWAVSRRTPGGFEVTADGDTVYWAANKRFEILKFKFKFPIARTFELFRARSRLYRSQILQVNTRWKALAEIYTMHSFAPFSNITFFVNNC